MMHTQSPALQRDPPNQEGFSGDAQVPHIHAAAAEGATCDVAQLAACIAYVLRSGGCWNVMQNVAVTC
jgi:hypothetical protein